MTKNNPLLLVAELPLFEDIKSEHIESAVNETINNCEKLLIETENSQEISWNSLMTPLEEVSRALSSSWGVVAHLHSVRNSDALREAYNKVLPSVIQFSLRMSQSEMLFEKLTNLSKQSAELSDAQNRALKLYLKSAKLSGMELKGKEKDRFNEISKELSELSTTFSNNVLDSTKEFSLEVHDEKDMHAVPTMFKKLWSDNYKAKTSKESSEDKGPWLVSLDHASATPFLKYSPSRDKRKQLYLAQIQKASSGKYDNKKNIEKILELREEKAKLLGFEDFSELSLASKMAPNVDAIYALIDELVVPSKPIAISELKEIEDYAKSLDSIDELKNWDFSYYSEKYKEKKYAFNEEVLRDYFQLDSVLDGLFELASNLFDITIKKQDTRPQVWDDSVEFYKVFNLSNEHIASFYLDPYSRPENKRGGAWVNTCLDKGSYHGKEIIPVAYIVCNFTPASGDASSKLSFYEVETLFHEFGHALQHMLTSVDVLDVAGINGVDWDAVELPSQFMENWCYHKDTIKKFALHFETKAPIPDELFEKIILSKNYLSAVQMLRQLLFAKTDLKLHSSYSKKIDGSVFDLYQKLALDISPMKPLAEDHFLCGFGHIFAGGYSAGYYSYKWAEVLSADAFSKFEDAGLNDEATIKKVGLEFKNTVLSLGGSLDPMEVFIKFRGRKPETKALLKHSGLI